MMTCFAFPNAVLLEKRFIGCGRYTALPSGSSDSWRRPSSTIINRARVEQATSLWALKRPATVKEVYERKDLPEKKYAGESMHLAYLLALIHRTRALRHDWNSDDVNSVSFSPDGTRIASGSGLNSRDKTIRLWSVETGKELAILRGHSSDVNSVSFSPDGNHISSGSRDNTIRLWDVETGKEISVLRGHSDDVHSVSFSPDGTRIATVSSNDTIRLWDVKTGKELISILDDSSEDLEEGYDFENIQSVSLNLDGTSIAKIRSGRRGQFWVEVEGNNLHGRNSRLVSSVSFSPNGNRIVIGSEDNRVRVWNAETGKEIFVIANMIRQDVIDREAVDQMIAERRDKILELADLAVDRLIAFHAVLTPEQREKIADHIKSRADKKCRFRD